MPVIRLIVLIAMLFDTGSYNSYENKLSAAYFSSGFKLGNEALIEMQDSPLKGNRIGLITNNSGVTSDGRLFLDLLNDHHNVTKIFTPEHGLRGNERNEDYRDDVTGAYVVSLYGGKYKPTPDDLADVDVLVYDLQDVSARFYTFINTLYYCIEAAAENKKKLIVCDRPIIPDGNYVDGFVLERAYSSFVGLMEIPAAYAMTCGELANFINDEYMNGECDIEVSKMLNYSRDMNYDDLNLYWKTPSPNMYFPSTAVAYLGTCLLEGTNFGEGRGTNKPFEYVGAPYCDGNLLAAELNGMGLNGVEFTSIEFTPRQIMSWMGSPKYNGENCGGIYINVKDRTLAEPFKITVALFTVLQEHYPQFSFNGNNFIDKLAGTDRLRNMVVSGRSYEDIISSYTSELERFKEKRKKYLVY